MKQPGWVLACLAVSTVSSVAQTANAVRTETPVWRQLIVVFTRAEVLDPRQGTLQRYYIDEPEIARIREELQLFEARAERAAAGGVDVRLEIVFDRAPIRRGLLTGASNGTVILEDPVTAALKARVNDFAFESDDKTFRGPYDGVLAMDADPTRWSQPSDSILLRFGTPMGVMGTVPLDGAMGRGALANQAVSLWLSHWNSRAQAVRPLPLDLNGLPFGGQSFFAPQGVLPGAALPMGANSGFGVEPIAGIFKGIEEVQTEYGTGQRVTVTSGLREGEVPLPSTVAGNSGGVLEFWVNSAVGDPLELTFEGSPSQSITLFPASAPLGSDTPERTVLLADGAWVQVRVPVQGVQPGTPIRLQVPQWARYREIRQAGERQITFAGLRWLSSAETAGFSSVPLIPARSIEDELSSSVATDQIRGLSRLRAEAQVPVSLVPRLSQLARSAQPAVAMLAVWNLGRLDTPEAERAFEYAIQVGPFEHARFAAAAYLAENPSPTRTPKLAAMLTASEWPTRWISAQALSRVPSRETAIILLAMLPDPEPTVRAAIVRGVPMENELVMRRLLFVAVNDVSEEVRLTAYRRLAAQGTGEYLSEALRGVRDESARVRVGLLEKLGELAREDQRRFVLVGLSDRDPRARVAAINALKAFPSTTREEIAPLLQDPVPQVRAAAEQLDAFLRERR